MECPICLEHESKLIQFPCRHCICEGCFFTYLNYIQNRKPFECPICRAVIFSELTSHENRADDSNLLMMCTCLILGGLVIISIFTLWATYS